MPPLETFFTFMGMLIIAIGIFMIYDYFPKKKSEFYIGETPKGYQYGTQIFPSGPLPKVNNILSVPIKPIYADGDPRANDGIDESVNHTFNRESFADDQYISCMKFFDDEALCMSRAGGDPNYSADVYNNCVADGIDWDICHRAAMQWGKN